MYMRVLTGPLEQQYSLHQHGVCLHNERLWCLAARRTSNLQSNLHTLLKPRHCAAPFVSCSFKKLGLEKWDDFLNEVEVRWAWRAQACTQKTCEGCSH